MLSSSICCLFTTIPTQILKQSNIFIWIMVKMFSGLEPLKLSYPILPKTKLADFGITENYSQIWIFHSVLLRCFGSVKTW